MQRFGGFVAKYMGDGVLVYFASSAAARRMGFYLRCRRLQSGAAAQVDRGGKLMAKVPPFAKAFAGRWRIVEMDNWDSDLLDLVEEAHLTFEGKSDGEIAFGALRGFLDVRYGARDGSACAEFSWEGHDENDTACGRGWTIIGTASRLVGHFYIHNGDDFRLRLQTRLSSSTAC